MARSRTARERKIREALRDFGRGFKYECRILDRGADPENDQDWGQDFLTVKEAAAETDEGDRVDVYVYKVYSGGDYQDLITNVEVTL